jgi:hypothetical protein
MLISPKIIKDPYGEKEYVEMANKIDSICGQGYSKKQLNLMLKELRRVDHTNKTLNKEVCRDLNNKMNNRLNSKPCTDVFCNSMYIELYKSFRHHPIKEMIKFIEKLTIMSKN